jgi:hypothetical protein
MSMLVAHRLPWKLAALIGIAAFASSPAHGISWYDDFNDGSVTDGNPVPWILDLNGSGFFPGEYDASSGDFRMKPAANSPTDQMSALVPVTMTDTYIRTQGTVLPDPGNPSNVGGNLVVTVRVDPAALTGYLMYFDVGGNLNIQMLAGGGLTFDIGTSADVSFNAGSEVVMELNVIGNQLNGYVWAADDPAGKPAEPQATAFDTTFTSGFAGLAFAEDQDGTAGIYRYAAAQDTPFVDLNPSNGDFNGDGTVDGADFLIWQRGFGLSGQPDGTTGDANADGNVNAADLAIWESRFGGAPAVASVGAVPEPASLAMLAAGALALAGVRSRQGRA